MTQREASIDARRHGRSVALWAGVLGAPAVWGVQLQAGYMLVPWTCSPAYADRLSNGSVAVMDWGGHACNVTDPATFNHITLEFLRS